MNEGLELNNIGFTNFIHLKLDKLVTYHLILFHKFIGHELSLKNYWYLHEVWLCVHYFLCRQTNKQSELYINIYNYAKFGNALSL